MAVEDNFIFPKYYIGYSIFSIFIPSNIPLSWQVIIVLIGIEVDYITINFINESLFRYFLSDSNFRHFLVDGTDLLRNILR